MEIIGTNFTLTLGSWRLRFAFAVEDTDDFAPMPKARTPHKMRLVREDEYVG